MSALSDTTNVDLTRHPERDGDVRDEPWFREVTGITSAFYDRVEPDPTTQPDVEDGESSP